MPELLSRTDVTTHPDAYSLIAYRSENRHLSARYFNARNAPAPNWARLADLSMGRRQPINDLKLRNHTPRLGDKVLVDLTSERLWDYLLSPEPLDEWNVLTSSERAVFADDFFLYESTLAQAHERDLELGGPILVRVTEELMREFGWTA